MQIILSQLEEVELREVWPNEAQDFTTWLAEPENLARLGDTLGMELELEGTEVNVGGYKADILCKNEDDSWVVIENQLEETNHRHLGQLLTYSVGLDAHTVIWIAKEFREEHRAVLDRLNKITDESFQCFGVRIKVVKIDDSLPAPQFEIVSEPNNRNARARRTSQENLTPTRELQLKFWTQFAKHLTDTKHIFSLSKPPSRAKALFSIVGTPCSLLAEVKVKKKIIRVRLVTNQGYFDALKEKQADIHKDFGEPLKWEEKPNQQARSIGLEKPVNPEDENDWNNQHKWIASKLTDFDNVFRDRLQEIDPDDYEPSENADSEDADAE